MPNGFAGVAAAAVLAGGVHLRAYYAHNARLAGIAKAVPIALLLAWVLLHAPVAGEGYRRLIAAGLLFSMGGDLLLSRERFRAGLVMAAGDMIGHRPADLGRQRTIAALCLLALQAACTMTELGRVTWPAQRRGLQVAEGGEIGKTQLARQAGHGDRGHASPARLLTHGQQGNIVRVFEHEARCRLQLRRQAGKGLGDAIAKRRVGCGFWHGGN